MVSDILAITAIVKNVDFSETFQDVESFSIAHRLNILGHVWFICLTQSLPGRGSFSDVRNWSKNDPRTEKINNIIMAVNP